MQAEQRSVCHQCECIIKPAFLASIPFVLRIFQSTGCPIINFESNYLYVLGLLAFTIGKCTAGKTVILTVVSPHGSLYDRLTVKVDIPL